LVTNVLLWCVMLIMREAMHVQGQGVYRKSLSSLLNFAKKIFFSN